MDPEFFDLHRDVEVSPSEDQLAARWAAVEEVTSQPSTSMIMILARLAHGRAVSDEDRESFWTPFKEKDPTFPIRDAELLHSTLAVGCLRELLQSDDEDRGGLTALMVRLAESVRWEPIRADMLRPEVQQYFVDKEPRVATERPQVASTPAVWTKSLSESVQTQVTSGSWDQIYAGIESVATAADTALKAVAKNHRSLAAWSDSEISRLTEDNSIMTWLLAGVRSDGTPWAKLKSPQLAIESGLDLASRVSRTLGPPNADAILSQIVDLADTGGSTPSYTIAEAIEGVAASARQAPDELGDLTPIHWSRSGRTLPADLAEQKWSDHELSRLAYVEALTIRAWTNIAEPDE
jgi:hypothetical protein